MHFRFDLPSPGLLHEPFARRWSRLALPGCLSSLLSRWASAAGHSGHREEARFSPIEATDSGTRPRLDACFCLPSHLPFAPTILALIGNLFPTDDTTRAIADPAGPGASVQAINLGEADKLRDRIPIFSTPATTTQDARPSPQPRCRLRRSLRPRYILLRHHGKSSLELSRTHRAHYPTFARLDQLGITYLQGRYTSHKAGNAEDFSSASRTVKPYVFVLLSGWALRLTPRALSEDLSLPFVVNLTPLPTST